MKYKKDGTPISSASLNLGTTGKPDLSDSDILKILNVANRANEISIASIREVYFVDNVNNQSKNKVEYRVRIEFGPRHGQEYESVMAINLYGGVTNFSETIYYPKTKLIEGKNENDEDAYIFDHDASQVVVAFMNGFPNQPFIIGSWQNTNHPQEFVTKESDGQRHIEEYNGMRLEKNKDGEWILTYYGGQRDTQSKGTERPTTAPTFIKFDKTGALILEDKENQRIKLDRANKTITLSQGDRTKPDETYGEESSDDSINIINEIKMDKAASKITFKAGIETIVTEMDGAVGKFTITIGALVVTIDKLAEKITFTTGTTTIEMFESGKINLTGSLVDVGEMATDMAVLGPALFAWLATHTHIVTLPTLPTSPPTIPPPVTILSASVRLKK